MYLRGLGTYVQVRFTGCELSDFALIPQLPHNGPGIQRS